MTDIWRTEGSRHLGIVGAAALVTLVSQLTLSIAAEDCQADGLSFVQRGLPEKRRTAKKEHLASSGSRHHSSKTVPNYQLNDGHTIPAIGLGVYRIPPGQETYHSVATALQLGYRMVDTAAIYRNEVDVGRAIRDSGLPRSEIFVTTKVFNSEHGYLAALQAGRRSNVLLGLGYIDLLLIHSPLGPPWDENHGKIVETYDALLQLQKEGVVRSVGVSNFGVKHLEALRDYCRPTPVINQFELHPLVYEAREDVVEYCKEHNILVQPYGSVLAGHANLLSLVDSMSAEHNKTEAQVLLRWGLEQGFQVIPKSTKLSHQEENFGVFDFTLTPDEVQSLNSLNAASDHTVTDSGQLKEYWDPLDAPVDVGDTRRHPASCP